MLEDLPPSGSAIALSPSRVWQIARAVYRRSPRNCARRGPAEWQPAPVIAIWRKEHDLQGERELPDTAYYGVLQTLRGMENFLLFGIPLRHFQHFAAEFADVLKMGCTENQGAVAMTLGQELGAQAVVIGDGVRHLGQASTELLRVNMGTNANGTGVSSLSGYAELCTQRLAEITDLPVTLANDLVEATQDC